jgi:hypothetical protein
VTSSKNFRKRGNPHLERSGLFDEMEGCPCDLSSDTTQALKEGIYRIDKTTCKGIVLMEWFCLQLKRNRIIIESFKLDKVGE